MSKILFKIVCKYEVYPSEMDEIEEIIRRSLDFELGGKFSNVQIEIYDENH